MRAALSALRFNELLGFVHLSHSSLPEPFTVEWIIQSTHRRLATSLAGE
jgi:hypothetical protein